MSQPYHAILLDTEFSDPEFLGRWKLLGQKKSKTNPWSQMRIEVPEERLEELVNDGQNLLLSDKFYFQAYRDNELIVVFPRRIFYLKQDRTDWQELIAYGRTLGIPEDQLDIKPVKFSEETY